MQRLSISELTYAFPVEACSITLDGGSGIWRVDAVNDRLAALLHSSPGHWPGASALALLRQLVAGPDLPVAVQRMAGGACFNLPIKEDPEGLETRSLVLHAAPIGSEPHTYFFFCVEEFPVSVEEMLAAFIEMTGLDWKRAVLVGPEGLVKAGAHQATNPERQAAGSAALFLENVLEPALIEPAYDCLLRLRAGSGTTRARPSSQSVVSKSAVSQSAVSKSAVSQSAVSKSAVSQSVVSKSAVSNSAVSRSATSKSAASPARSAIAARRLSDRLALLVETDRDSPSQLRTGSQSAANTWIEHLCERAECVALTFDEDLAVQRWFNKALLGDVVGNAPAVGLRASDMLDLGPNATRFPPSMPGRRPQTRFSARFQATWNANRQWMVLQSEQEPPLYLAVLDPPPAATEVGAAGETSHARLLHHIDSAILAISGDGEIEFFSSVAERLWRCAASDILGQPIDNLIVPDTKFEQTASALIRATTSTAPARFEGCCRTADGNLLPIAIVCQKPDDPAVSTFVLTVRELSSDRLTQEKIRRLTYHDLLTGLPNRLLFCDRLNAAIERARREHHLVCTMLVDLDRFKLFNDSLGLYMGDEVIRAVGSRLSVQVGARGTVARLGGDEFMVCIEGLNAADEADTEAMSLIECLLPHLVVGSHELAITACVGVALFPHDGHDAETLIQNADVALTGAKEQGQGRYQFFTDDMNVAAFDRLMLETRLRKALSQNELQVYYQPQVSSVSGEIIGVEALLRWVHPELGIVPPGEFIPLAEETGLIVPIGEWALEAACRQVRIWHEAGCSELRLAVNLSARQFEHPDLVTRINRVLTSTSFPARLLELELTESVIMRDGGEIVDRLNDLRALGASLAIDDFGRGYSSLAYLKRFPIRSLKIDHSFIRDIDHDHNSAAIAQAIVAMGAALGLKIVAEGVETTSQLDVLRGYGCQEVQGFLFGKPLPPGELEERLLGARIPEELEENPSS